MRLGLALLLSSATSPALAAEPDTPGLATAAASDGPAASLSRARCGRLRHPPLRARPIEPSPSSPSPLPRSALEKLPKWLIVVPLALQWLLLALRYRSLTLPALANPAITAGGLVGEGKTEYFAGMGPLARAATAAHGSLVTGSADDFGAALALMRETGLAFPIIAKPDIGWCGFGVQRIDDERALARYLAGFPRGERVVLQAFIADEGEAGIFYQRSPGAAQGHITGLALRRFPQLLGDGRRCLAELIAADPRLQRLGRDGLHRIELDLQQVPPAGTRLRLSTIGSTRVGGLYRDGEALITPALVAAIDAIARDMDRFHFGRFDVRYASEAALMRGEGFSIIEVNGAGSEAIEAWDPRHGLGAAFRRIFRKQARLFAIAAANRQSGLQPLGPRALARLHLRQQALIPRYPPSN